MSTATEWMTIYVKTLAGDVLAVECPLDIAPGDFPFRVYPLLSEPRPPMAFLRFIPSKELELEGEEKGEEKRREKRREKGREKRRERRREKRRDKRREKRREKR